MSNPQIDMSNDMFYDYLRGMMWDQQPKVQDYVQSNGMHLTSALLCNAMLPNWWHEEGDAESTHIDHYTDISFNLHGGTDGYFANIYKEAIAYAKEWKCNTLQYFLRKEQSELSAILYKAVVGCMHRTYAFKAHKEIFKIAVSPNWFSPTEEWLNKYKITQLRLLAKKLDVDVLPTDNKKMVMHRLLAAFSEGAEFDPIKFLEEVK